jgi:hypothetical protein
MKRITGIVMMIALASGVFAQDSARQRPSHDRIRETLHLTDKQTSDLKDINRSFIGNAKTIRGDQSLSKEQRQTRLEALQNEREEKIKGVLSAEQFSQWQQNRATMKDRMASGKKWNKSHRMQEDLGLTNDQQQQFRGIYKDFHTQVKSIRQNDALTAEQKQEQLGKLKEEHDVKVKGMLNAEQYEKYQQWVAKRQQRMKEMKRMEDRQLPGKAAPGKS